MCTTSKINRWCLPALSVGALTLALTVRAAEHENANSSNPQSTAPSSAVVNPLSPGPELTIGRGTNDNLSFKQMSEYEQRQSAGAVQKLEKIRELRGGSNEWSEVSRLLREVIATDTSKNVKTDVKRLARIELAGIAERNGQPEQALQLLAEYIDLFPTDPIIPEILLREGYLLRQMGATELAISKFYLVNTAALRLPAENLGYYQRVTLMAKSEIAETYYSQGKYKEAASSFLVLLNDPSDELNRLVVRTKLIRSLAQAGDYDGVVKHGLDFLEQHGASEFQAEVRYILASAYKSLDRKQESLRELMRLLEAVEVAPENLAAKWKSWKMLAGNEIGNRLFLEGDHVNAVVVYKGLVGLDSTPSWQFPLYYQIGLCFEKTSQPGEALKAYNEIITLSQKISTKLPENLQLVVNMAKFRVEVITWRQSLEPAQRPPEQKVAEKAN